MNTIEARLQALEKHSHEPQDIAPRVIEELDRAVILLGLFREIPTKNLEFFARNGLDMFAYFQDENDPRGESR